MGASDNVFVVYLGKLAREDATEIKQICVVLDHYEVTERQKRQSMWYSFL